ncbi:hypothetical protein Fmac_019521 [Flemingia macrophylla]|uniref:Fatty acyl-CoA reductase n=1 Tax=Flemingia macrophylla TaxID=520843 RepID=A0ABD1M9Y8_9FABA
MAEMVVGTTKGNVNVVIIRPTIISSTYKGPFPGWIEDLRTMDSIIVAYGKGKLTSFLVDLEAVFDVIPADMVVNEIIVAMVAHAKEPNPSDIIYHVGSSVINPIKYLNLRDYSLKYFTQKPWINKDGKPVKVGKLTILSDMASFLKYMYFRYQLPLKGLELVNAVSYNYFEEMYADFNRKMQTAMRLVELYKPYLLFNGLFDNRNSEKLLSLAKMKGGGEMEAKESKWGYLQNILPM